MLFTYVVYGCWLWLPISARFLLWVVIACVFCVVDFGVVSLFAGLRLDCVCVIVAYCGHRLIVLLLTNFIFVLKLLVACLGVIGDCLFVLFGFLLICLMLLDFLIGVWLFGFGVFCWAYLGLVVFGWFALLDCWLIVLWDFVFVGLVGYWCGLM